MKVFILSMFVFAVLAAGSVTMARGDDTPSRPLPVTHDNGTTVYNGEYRFVPPPQPWELLRGNETTTYVLGFYRKDSGTSPNSTFFAYDEEPYGYSRDMEERSAQFLKRFFWSSNVKVNVLEKRKSPVLGGEGMLVLLEGRDPVKKHKVKSKIYFGRRGERIVAFWCNQWRTFDSDYDPSAFNVFDRFVGSFTFLKKSFYENL